MPSQNTNLPENVEASLEVLRDYGNGGRRPALMPLDDFAASAAGDGLLSRVLEMRLKAILDARPHYVAAQYTCGKLAMIGRAGCVDSLARLLEDPKVAADARSALESIPDAAAGRAILKWLPKLAGAERAGAIVSLGNRRDAFAVQPLARVLREGDSLSRNAAAGALGRIGTASAAAQLRKFHPAADLETREAMTDAMLECAEALEASDPKEATRLRELAGDAKRRKSRWPVAETSAGRAAAQIPAPRNP